MSRSSTKLFALLASALLAFAACSEDAPDPEANPQAAFTDAVEALQDYEGVEVVLSLQASPEALEAIAAESGGGLPPDLADQIASSSLEIRSKGETPEDSQAQILLNLAGTEAFEMRVVNQSLYARADVQGIADLFGADVSSLEAGVQQAEAAGLTFVRPAVEGEWIGLEGFDNLLEQMTGQPLPTAPSDEQQQIIDQLTDVLKENVTVTSGGSDEVGDRVSVSLPIRDTVQNLYDAMSGITQMPLGAPPDLSEIPEGDVTFDAWISDGRLAQIELDFIQFARLAGEEVPEGVDRVAVRMTIAEFTDDIEVPEGAVLVDPQQFMQGVMGGMGAMGGETAPAVEIPGLPGIACSDFAGLNPDDIRAFLKTTPGAIQAVKESCPGVL